MKLNGVEFTNPQFGYRTNIELPFHKAVLSNGNIKMYDDSNLYDAYECACESTMTKDEMEQFIEFYDISQRGEELTLEADDGFFPFTPIVYTTTDVDNAYTYKVYIKDMNYRGETNIVKKHFTVRYTFVLSREGDIVYLPTLPQAKPQGSMTFGAGEIAIEGVNYPERGFDVDKEYSVFPTQTQGGKVYGTKYIQDSQHHTSRMRFNLEEGMITNMLYRIVHSYRSSPFFITVANKYFPFGVDRGDDKDFFIRLVDGNLSVTHSSFNQFRVDLTIQEEKEVIIPPVTDTDKAIDFDGNVYESVIISGLRWTTTNLRTTHYLDGTVIPYVTSDEDWSDDTVFTPRRSSYNHGAPTAETYGQIYNSFTSHRPLDIADGWRIPTQADWNNLKTATSENGGSLKQVGFDTWNEPNTGATDALGFTALGGGKRKVNGEFENLGEEVFFLIAPNQPQVQGSYQNFHYDSADWGVGEISVGTQGGYIRLVRDI